MNKKVLKLKLEFCAAAVVFFVVLLTCGLSFGWFSQNKDVNANGMSVSALAKGVGVLYRIQNDDGTWPDEWSNMPNGIIPGTDAIACPGDKSVMQIKVTNISQADIVINSIGFNDFTIGTEEIANAKGKYLGTQIYADLMYITNVDTTDYTDVTVINDTTAKAKILDDSLIPSRLALYTHGEDDATLEYEEFFIYTIELEFVDSNESQDDYKNFGVDDDGKCERTLYVDYE